MKTDLLLNFTVDKNNRKILVEREFSAPLETVWAAWTESEILDQWWAPEPWKTKTKLMDFREGGFWLYSMNGPDGEQHWCRADFQSIEPESFYKGKDAFCDEKGNVNTEFPRSDWDVKFRERGENTLVKIEITYEKLSDLEKYIEMGFKEGFSSAMENLDRLLEKN